MKKILYLLSAVAFSFAISSCSKQDGSSGLPQPEDHSGEVIVPSSFSKRVMVEDLTGAWCGWCPRGAYFMDMVDTMYPGKVVGVAIHVGDVMEVPELITPGGNLLDLMFENTGYPNGSVNRGALSDPSQWPGLVPAETGLFAKCGFAIDASTLTGNMLKVVVNTGFASSMYGDYRLNVWIIESDVHSMTDPAYNQENYYSSSDSSIVYFYNLPPTINDFHHQNVLRKLVTSVPHGDQIPQDKMVKGQYYSVTFNIDLSQVTYQELTNLSVVAFIDKYGTAPDQHQVQNIQKVKVGSTVGW